MYYRFSSARDCFIEDGVCDMRRMKLDRVSKGWGVWQSKAKDSTTISMRDSGKIKGRMKDMTFSTGLSGALLRPW